MFRPTFERAALGVLLIAIVSAAPTATDAQIRATSSEAQPLLQLGAVVHRRITMLARRVQQDLGQARRFNSPTRATCLDDVLSNLHSVQRAVESWSAEVQRVEAVTPRLRGMIGVFRLNLKDLRAEAVQCIRGNGGPQAGETLLEVTIEGEQPDEDPSVLPRLVLIDVPYVLPGR